MREAQVPLESMRAFVLLELVFGVVILSIIAITLSQVTLSLQRQAIAKSSISLAQLSLSNAADSIRNRLGRESSFQFVDSTLHMQSHSVAFHSGALWLDGVLLAQDITSFLVQSLPNNAFSITLCAGIARETFCINRVGWLQ